MDDKNILNIMENMYGLWPIFYYKVFITHVGNVNLKYKHFHILGD